MASSNASKKVVYAALAGNALISITKFVASAMTGSSAMLSESIHSVVDTGNQALLLLGLRQAAKPADSQHPFGYGMELYFWSFVVAILLFALGAGVSVYEGIDKLRSPHPVSDPHINFIVLGVALIFESVAWAVAFKEFRKQKGTRGYLEGVRHSKDPAIFVVLFEDTAAVLGLITAFLGIALSTHFNNSMFDAGASIVIGIILATTAIFLALECKGLLIGEGASKAVVSGVEAIVEAHPGILAVNELLTMHLGPEDILLNISIDFSDDLSSGGVEQAISDLEQQIKESFPAIKRLFIEAQSVTGHQSARAKSH